jgi:NADH-quinone oxidoreductase subunit E
VAGKEKRMERHRKLDIKTMNFAGEEGKLIPALQRVQIEDGFISRERMREIQRESGVPLAQIYGVATFYSQFRLHPVGKHIVRVCHGTACHVSGAKSITETLEDSLGIATGETTPDKLFTLEMVSCLGCCSLAPVIMIDNSTYGNLTPAEVKKIVKKYKKANEEVVQK